MKDEFLSLLQKEVFTGLLLSDGMLTKRNKGINGKASFSLTQTCNPNSEYVFKVSCIYFYSVESLKINLTFERPDAFYTNKLLLWDLY